MTSAEMLTALQDRLLGNYGLSDPTLYRYLTRAQRYAENNTKITFEAAVPIKTTSGDGTFDLSSAAVIQLRAHPSTSTAYTVLTVDRVHYYNVEKIVPVNYAEIRANRQISGSQTGYPEKFSFRNVGSALGGTPTLDLWPHVIHTETSFATAKLAVDVTWRTTDISALVAPATPAYSHDFIWLWAAYCILAEGRAPGLAAGLHNANLNGEADKAFKVMRNTSNNQSSGRLKLGLLQ